MNLANNDHPVGWNGNIQDGANSPLDPGTYNFRVTSLEEKANQKLQCNQINLKLDLVSMDGYQRGQGNSSLIFHSRCIWKVAEFLVSIGLKKPGEDFHGSREIYNTMVGMEGLCTLKHKTLNKKNLTTGEFIYDNTGKQETVTFHEIDKFLPKQVPSSGTPAYQQQPVAPLPSPHTAAPSPQVSAESEIAFLQGENTPRAYSPPNQQAQSTAPMSNIQPFPQPAEPPLPRRNLNR